MGAGLEATTQINGNAAACVYTRQPMVMLFGVLASRCVCLGHLLAGNGYKSTVETTAWFTLQRSDPIGFISARSVGSKQTQPLQ